MSLINTWLADGSFKLLPKILYPMYTINVALQNFAPPCVIVLIPNRTEKLYIRMTDLLNEGTKRNPEQILRNIKKAALHFGKKCPHTKLSSCFFST